VSLSLSLSTFYSHSVLPCTLIHILIRFLFIHLPICFATTLRIHSTLPPTPIRHPYHFRRPRADILSLFFFPFGGGLAKSTIYLWRSISSHGRGTNTINLVFAAISIRLAVPCVLITTPQRNSVNIGHPPDGHHKYLRNSTLRTTSWPPGRELPQSWHAHVL
jgi:hypothetical protein